MVTLLKGFHEHENVNAWFRCFSCYQKYKAQKDKHLEEIKVKLYNKRRTLNDYRRANTRAERKRLVQDWTKRNPWSWGDRHKGYF